MCNKEILRRKWLIANPTIKVDELVLNTDVHTNTGYKILSDSKKLLKTKKISERTVTTGIFCHYQTLR